VSRDNAIAARGATAGALINGGQDCTAATRAYVHRDVYDAFLARTGELFDAVRVGDPFDATTDLGTLISDTQVARVAGFVERAVAAGARVVAGGFAPDVDFVRGVDAGQARHARIDRRAREGLALHDLWGQARGLTVARPAVLRSKPVVLAGTGSIQSH
jgi:hypothetical protein